MKVIYTIRGIFIGGLVGVVVAVVAEVAFFTVFGLTLFGDAADFTSKILYVLPLAIFSLVVLIGGIVGFRKGKRQAALGGMLDQKIWLTLFLLFIGWVIVAGVLFWGLVKLNEPPKNVRSYTIEEIMLNDPLKYSSVANGSIPAYKTKGYLISKKISVIYPCSTPGLCAPPIPSEIKIGSSENTTSTLVVGIWSVDSEEKAKKLEESLQVGQYYEFILKPGQYGPVLIDFSSIKISAF